MALRSLTADGQSRLAEIARRHGVSDAAAAAMLMALTHGGGTMAQFSHPEFGGSGQWMRGGMTMVGDLFNNALKATVDNLCNDLSALLLNPPPGTWQETPSPGPSSFGGGFGGADWWPAELGMPNASGAQNDLRYAYFADAGRLAIDIAGTRTLYDTADHRISGVSQQQGNGWSLTFTSQYGTVPVSSLRVVDGGPQPADAAAAPPAPIAPDPVPAPAPNSLAPDTLAPDTLAGTVWSFGPTGAAGTTITLAPDGGITGSGDPRVRYWSAEDGGLTFYDSDGRVSVRFAVPAAAAPGTGLSGHDPARPDQSYALMPPAPPREATVSPSVSPALPLDVTAGDWLLEDRVGNRLCVLRLSTDGRVEGGRASEAAWRITDSSVVLLHGSGRPTARFDILQFRAGRWTLIGSPLNDESATLFLKQP